MTTGNWQKSFLIALTILLTGCFGLFDSGSDGIVGQYEVAWIDLREQQFICKRSEESTKSCFVLVPEYVFAVGHNDNYIIVKQHPTSGFERGFKIDATITHYFIVELKKNSEKVFGPLTKSQFDGYRKEFRIESIPFDINYPEVP